MEFSHISDEELLTDIRNTEIELGAYLKLSEGFEELSRLPEIESGRKNHLRYQSQNYKDDYDKCLEFLDKLYKIRLERNLQNKSTVS